MLKYTPIFEICSSDMHGPALWYHLRTEWDTCDFPDVPTLPNCYYLSSLAILISGSTLFSSNRTALQKHSLLFSKVWNMDLQLLLKKRFSDFTDGFVPKHHRHKHSSIETKHVLNKEIHI